MGKYVLPVILIGLLMAGCAATGAGQAIQLPPSTPSKVQLSSVPFYAQKRHQCGPAALAMALRWSGVEVTPDQLVDAVYTPGRKGSLQSGLTTATRRHGRLAYPIKGLQCLIREVAAGSPVIVLQNLGLKWIPRWHYATVIGFDLDQSSVTLHTGETASRQVGLNTFAATWKRAGDWGLLVLPAERMPQCAEETTYLKAAHGLQVAGQSEGAIQAFGQAVSRWPQSACANIALGNALYLDGSKQEAIESYFRAVQIQPQNGDALNNLAHLLAESGALQEAENMAARAVDTGGPHLQVYRQTLEEIRRKRR
jgi:predicted Zn-dependent protease